MNQENSDSKICPTCGRPTHRESKYCIFHASVKEKTEEEFKNALKEYIQEIKEGDKAYDFEGFIFIGDINFKEDLNVTIFKNANFMGATFEGDAGFMEATLKGDANFKEVTFEGYANFWRATFKGGANFREATFKGGANFREATFKGDAGFWRATFKGGANFREATFKGNAGFMEATFEGDAYFTEATFEGDAYFTEATFEGDAGFTEATFEGDAGFRKATFEGGADFRKATFEGDADFRKATFEGGAYFIKTAFNGDANFTGAIFNGDANFMSATFERFTYFTSATFEHDANFAEAIFEISTEFKGTIFKGDACFEDTTFMGHSTYFTNAVFERVANFFVVKFKGNANFKEVAFNEDAYFEEATFEGDADFVLKYFVKNLNFSKIKTISGKKLFIRLNNKRGKISFERAYLENTDLDIELVEGILIDFTGALLRNTKIKREQIENHILQEKKKVFYEAQEIFLLLKNNFHSIGRYNDESWAFIKEKDMEKMRKSFYSFLSKYKKNSLFRKILKHSNLLKRVIIKLKIFSKWLFSKEARESVNLSASNIIYQYGESPGHVIRNAFWTIFIFAILLNFSGIVYSDRTNLIIEFIKESKGGEYTLKYLGPILGSFLNCLYFSVVTFTTLGYGDFQPAVGLSRFFVSLESIIGAITMALFVYTFARRTGGR